MSDTQASMREFRFLDEQRKTNGLMPADEERWQALALSLGVDLTEHQQPAQAPQGAYGADGQWYPAQPQGYYGPDGQWYQAAPQNYYPPPPQGYYGPDGQWYHAPPQGYAPQPQGAYGADGQWYPAAAQQPGWYDPAQQQQAPSAQPWGQPQWEQQPPAAQPWGQPQWDANQQQWVQPLAPRWDANQQQWVQPTAPPHQPWVEAGAPAPAEAWVPPAAEAPWQQPSWSEQMPSDTQSDQAPAAWSPDAQQPTVSPEPTSREPVEASRASEPQATLDVTDEVMEIGDEEVVEIPATSPPVHQFKAALAPAPAVVPLVVPAVVTPPSDDPVAELRNALSFDDDEPAPVASAAGVTEVPASPLVAAPPIAAPEPALAPPLGAAAGFESPLPPQTAPAEPTFIALVDSPVAQSTEPTLTATAPLDEPSQPVAPQAPLPPPSSAPSYAEVVARRAHAETAFADFEPLPLLEASPAEPALPPASPLAAPPEAAQPSLPESVEPAPVSTLPGDLQLTGGNVLVPETEPASVLNLVALAAPPPVAPLLADLEEAPLPVAPPLADLEEAPQPVAPLLADLEEAPQPVAPLLADLEEAPQPVAPLLADLEEAPLEEPLEGSTPTDVGAALALPAQAVLQPEALPPAPLAPPPFETLRPAAVEPEGFASLVADLDEQRQLASRPVGSFEPAMPPSSASELSRVATPVEVPVFDASPALVASAFAGLALPPEPAPIPTFEPAPSAAVESSAFDGEPAETPEAGATDVVFASNWDEQPALPAQPLGVGLEEATRPEVARLGSSDVTSPGVPMPLPVTVTGHEATSPAALLPNWDALEVSREPTSPGVPMPEWGAEELTPRARPAVTAPTEWGALPNLEGDGFGGEAPLLEAALAGDPSERVALASNIEFLLGAVAPPVKLVEADLSVEADLGEFVVESGSAAALATGVAENAASAFDAAPLELAPAADFISHPALTSTGEQVRAPSSALSIEIEEEPLLEGEIIPGELEVDLDTSGAGAPSFGTDSWAVSVEPSAPLPVAPPPLQLQAPLPVPFRPPPPAPVLAVAPPPPRPVVPGFPSAPVAVAPSFAPAPPAVVRPAPVAVFDLSAPPLRPDDMPVSVSGEHRVILHTMEGGVKRGSICDVDLAGELVGLSTGPAAFEDVPRDRVKAIFFMLAPGSRAPNPEGAKVRVTFRDGRQVAGFSSDYKSTAIGFFVVPADNRTNTERIFIYRHAVSAVLPES